MSDKKQCSKCKRTYPAITEYFNKDIKGKNGLRNICKQCKRKCDKQYRRQNKVKCRQYGVEHRVELRQYQSRYYKTIRGYLSRIWQAMLSRCNNAKRPDYKYYGKRGIRVKFDCFEEFYDYVVKELKTDPRGLTIDRIDNYGHYEPGNIRFITRAENNRNKRKRGTP